MYTVLCICYVKRKSRLCLNLNLHASIFGNHTYGTWVALEHEPQQRVMVIVGHSGRHVELDQKLFWKLGEGAHINICTAKSDVIIR